MTAITPGSLITIQEHIDGTPVELEVVRCTPDFSWVEVRDGDKTVWLQLRNYDVLDVRQPEEVK